MKEKTIKISYDNWKRLKTAAAQKDTFIHNIVADIMDGKLDPLTV